MARLFTAFCCLMFVLQLQASDMKKLEYYVFSLNFEKAQQLIDLHKNNETTQIQAYYYQNYIDFLTALFTQNSVSFEKYSRNSDFLYQKIENSLQKSPHRLYSLAQIKFHNSIINFINGNNFSSAFDIYKSYKFLTENKKKFPNFAHNTKLLSAYQLIFSSVPSEYQWVLATFNLDADFEKGMKGLKNYFTQNQLDSLTKIESTLIYSLALMQFSNEKINAYNIIKTNNNVLNNSLLRYVFSIIANQNGKTEEIIKIIGKNKQSNEEFKIHFFDYQLGIAKLRQLDFSSKNDFLRFKKNYSGKNYLRIVNQQLAWISFLEGNTQNFLFYSKKVKNEGSLLLEKDKQALHEINKSSELNRNLLSARLLFDGAYYTKALAQLEECKHNELNSIQLLEYRYRKARTFHLLKEMEKAIHNYKETIELGDNSDSYFAPFSALQLAEIYNERNQVEMAKFYYDLALKLNTGEYKNSIEVKAKRGLKNCANK